MGNSTISMAIFNSYVSLPEGRFLVNKYDYIYIYDLNICDRDIIFRYMIYPYRLVNWPISTHLGPGFVVFPHGALHQVRTLALHPMLGMK